MENVCKICGGGFREGTLVNGKCPICVVDYPDANSLVEAMVQTGKKEDIHVNLTQERVREIVYEILSDAGIKRVACEKCKKLFYKISPAQRQCEKCKDKETK